MRGIGLKCLSVTIFMGMATCIKAVSDAIPPGETVFFRSFFAIPVILAWLLWRGELRTGLATRNPVGHVWRGLAGTISMGFNFTALGLLALPEATALGYAAPLITVILAAVILGEPVRAFRLSAVGVGLLGVLVILAPRFGLDSGGDAPARLATLGAILALLGALFAAFAQILVRRLVSEEPTSAIVFYFSASAAVIGLATLPFGWALPTPGQAGLLILAGLLGGVAQIFLTESYRHADISVIAPFEYVSMVLALLFGYFLFQEIPTGAMLVGAALIAAAGIAIIIRERQLGLQRARARRASTPQG